MATNNENQTPKPIYYKVGNDNLIMELPDGSMYRVLDFDTKKLQDLDRELTEDSEKWMQEAFKRKGLLHKRLGIPEDQEIPLELINSKIAKLRKKGEGDKKLSAEDSKFLKQLIAAKTGKKISGSKKDLEEKEKIKNLEKNKQVYNSSEKDSTEDLLDERPEIIEDMEKVNAQEHELDGSVAMKERFILDCQEKTGKSYEECSQEISAKMTSKKLENAVEDMDNKEENVKDMTEEKKREKKTDTVEVCKEKLDYLEKQSEELNALKKENERIKNEKDQIQSDFSKYSSLLESIKQQEDTKMHEEMNSKIKRMSKDFQLSEKEFDEENMKEIIENPSRKKVIDFIEKILDKAFNPIEEEEPPINSQIGEAYDLQTEISKKWFQKI